MTRWEPRTYPGDLARLRDVRRDLVRDLDGFDDDLVQTVILCASELFANSVKYTDSGCSGGEVLRFLTLTGSTWTGATHTDSTSTGSMALHLGLTDGGGSGRAPRVPVERTDDEWDWAEGQRGLAMVDQLARRWGHRRTAPWADLGTHVWADLSVSADQAPRRPRPYVFAD